MNDSISRFCFSDLKKFSTSQRALYSNTIVDAASVVDGNFQAICPLG